MKNQKFAVQSFLHLIRFKNLMIIVMMQYAAGLFLIKRGTYNLAVFLNLDFFLLVVSTILVAAAGYVINDYFDIKIDQYNKPDKVFVGRTISRRNAIKIHQIFNLIAVSIGFYLDIKIGILVFLSVTILWFYAERFKRMAFIGNFLVATMTFLSVFLVGLFFQKGRRIILIYALFAFVFTLIREIIKDLEDIRGDARYGCKTLPIIWGLRKTKFFIYCLVAFFIIQLILLSIPVDGFVLKIVFSLFILPVSWLVFKLYKADKKVDFAWLSHFCKIIMVMGILTMFLYNLD